MHLAWPEAAALPPSLSTARTSIEVRLARGAGRVFVLSVALMALCGVVNAFAQTLTISTSEDESTLREVGTRILTEAFERAGMRLILKPLPLQREIEEANDGVVDGDMHRIADVAAIYPNLIMVPTAIAHTTVAVYGTSPEIRTMTREELSGLRFAIPRGHFAARKYSRGMAVIEARVQSELFDLLFDHRVDAVMLDYVETQGLIASGKLTRPIVLWPHVWASEPQYLLINKRNAVLVPRIDAALRQMQREGLIEKTRADVLKRANIPALPASEGWPSPAKPVG